MKNVRPKSVFGYGDDHTVISSNVGIPHAVRLAAKPPRLNAVFLLEPSLVLRPWDRETYAQELGVAPQQIGTGDDLSAEVAGKQPNPAGSQP